MVLTHATHLAFFQFPQCVIRMFSVHQASEHKKKIAVFFTVTDNVAFY